MLSLSLRCSSLSRCESITQCFPHFWASPIHALLNVLQIVLRLVLLAPVDFRPKTLVHEEKGLVTKRRFKPRPPTDEPVNERKIRRKQQTGKDAEGGGAGGQ